jgi:NAD(P)-dependent dehydrogenase (short-subunit alcohol dehydrogenase family)
MKITSGMVAAITGAGSGMGRELALLLARRGCELALADVDQVKLAETAQLLQPLGVKVTTTVLDVSDRALVFRWADDCRSKHGKVNLLFNNAGVALSSIAESTQPQDFEWLMGINFWGVVHGTQAFMPLLRASGAGHVTNISSVFGLLAMPTQSAYNASKFAVRGFTEALRMELELEGAPVSASCVHPGGIGTNIARAGRVDPAIEGLTGETAQQQRERAHQMIQVTTAPEAAAQIVAGVERNARRILVGPDARRVEFITRFFGAAYQLLIMKQVRKMRAQRRSALEKAA